MAYKVTSDHDEIRLWIESRNGAPAILRGTAAPYDRGTVTLQFDELSSEFDPLGWPEFFDYLDTNGLALRYDDDPFPAAEPYWAIVDADTAIDNPEDETELPDSEEEITDLAEENQFASEPPEDEGETNPNNVA